MRPSAIILYAAALSVAVSADWDTKIDPIFAAYNKPDSPGCAVGVLQNGKTIFAKGYGMADLEQRVPITPRSRFYMASVSKHFTSMALLLAEQEGKLKLDDSVRKYIPELPAYADGIPLRRLLDHTAGFRDYLALWGMRGFSNESVLRMQPTLEMIVAQKALNFAPGSDHNYSNTGYLLATVALERATGKSLAEYAAEKIYKPLEMASSRFQDDHGTPIPGRAHGYDQRGGQWKTVDIGFDIVGSGGMYSNIEDMMKWARNFDQPVVGGALLPALQTPGKLNNGQRTPTGYALGLREVNGTYSHGGAATGYKTYLLRIPRQQTTVVTLCNAGDANSGKLTEAVAEVVTGVKLTQATEASPARAPRANATPVKLDELAGTYWSNELQTLWTLRMTNGKLSVITPGAEYIAAGADETGSIRLPAAGFTFQARRDTSGNVIGLTASAGRATGILFDLQKR